MSQARKRVLLRLCESDKVLVEPIDHLGPAWEAYRSSIDGATFDWDKKQWFADVARATMIASRLETAGFAPVLSEELRELMALEISSAMARIENAKAKLEAVDAELRKRGLYLFGFQRQDVIWLASRRRAINANQQGLGKTIETLCSVGSPDVESVLVICPSVAKRVWERETLKWRPDLRPIVLRGKNSFRWPATGEVCIINYDILPAKLPDLLPETGELLVVADEAHMLKNYKSARSVRFTKIAGHASRLQLLTGTPLANKPDELWTLLKAAGLAHEAYGSRKEFVRCFSGKEKHFEKKTGGGDTGESESKQLMFAGYEWGQPKPEAAERLKRVLLRHTREEVLPDLPTKTYRRVDVDLDDRTVRKWLDSDPEGLGAAVAAEDISQISFDRYSKTRAILASAKLDAVLEIAEEHEANGEPLIVFSMHREVIDKLGERRGWGKIVGAQSGRDTIEERFQKGEYIGIAATIQAASTALTLTRAAFVYFIDRSWTPADNDQSEDRACRIGQTRGVIVTDIVIDHPLDQRLWEKTRAKQEIINASVEMAREFKVNVESLMPRLPERCPAPVGARGPKSDEEREAMGVVTAISGLAGKAAPGVLLGHKNMAKNVVATAFAFDWYLDDKQWQLVRWLNKRYAQVVRKAREAGFLSS